MLIHSRKFRWKSIKMEVFFEVCSGRRQKQVPSLQSTVSSKRAKRRAHGAWREEAGGRKSDWVKGQQAVGRSSGSSFC